MKIGTLLIAVLILGTPLSISAHKESAYLEIKKDISLIRSEIEMLRLKQVLIHEHLKTEACTPSDRVDNLLAQIRWVHESIRKHHINSDDPGFKLFGESMTDAVIEEDLNDLREMVAICEEVQ